MPASSLDSAVIVGTAWLEHARYFDSDGDKQAMFHFSVSTVPRFRDPDTNEWKNGDSTTHYVTVFGKQAENCHNAIKNRDHVIIIGHNRTRSYEKDGEKKYSTDLIADYVGISLYWQRDDTGGSESSSGSAGSGASSQPSSSGASGGKGSARKQQDDGNSDNFNDLFGSDDAVTSIFE